MIIIKLNFIQHEINKQKEGNTILHLLYNAFKNNVENVFNDKIW